MGSLSDPASHLSVVRYLSALSEVEMESFGINRCIFQNKPSASRDAALSRCRPESKWSSRSTLQR